MPMRTLTVCWLPESMRGNPETVHTQALRSTWNEEINPILFAEQKGWDFYADFSFRYCIAEIMGQTDNNQV